MMRMRLLGRGHEIVAGDVHVLQIRAYDGKLRSSCKTLNQPERPRMVIVASFLSSAMTCRLPGALSTFRHTRQLAVDLSVNAAQTPSLKHALLSPSILALMPCP